MFSHQRGGGHQENWCQTWEDETESWLFHVVSWCFKYLCIPGTCLMMHNDAPQCIKQIKTTSEWIVMRWWH
jgi:hypothetical protein